MAMLAGVRMTGNLVAATILLMLGVSVVRMLRGSSSRPRWLPLVAFLAGPGTSLLWIAADYLWLQPYNYLTVDDAIHTVTPVLILGLIVGAVGALIFWIGDHTQV